jgi:hypothetical protein
MAEWFVVISDKKFGPLDNESIIKHIKNKKINSSTLIWKEGDKDWVEIGNIPEFSEFLSKSQEKNPPQDLQPQKRKKSTMCFCRNCGGQIDPKAEVCLLCGANPRTGTDFCNNCGADTNPKAIVCIKCGCKLSNNNSGLLDNISSGGDFITPPNPPKDPILMALLSGCCIAWLGQILMGQTTKGLVMLAVSISLALLGVGLLFWPIAAVDAFLIAKKLKDGKLVKQWEFF